MPDLDTLMGLGYVSPRARDQFAASQPAAEPDVGSYGNVPTTQAGYGSDFGDVYTDLNNRDRQLAATMTHQAPQRNYASDLLTRFGNALGPSWLDRAAAEQQRQSDARAAGGTGMFPAGTQGAMDLASGFAFPATTKAAGALSDVEKGITAFHGSPYDFDRFDLSKIGTGEGAQAYGHGLYFAENPAVAQQYKENLSMGAAERDMHYMTTGEELPKGGIYQVSINADPEHFLDYDKQYLAEQTPHVQEALKRAGVPDMQTELLARRMGPAQAKRLAEAGIPGIKYLDQGSRGSGQGTSNYVVFDDKLIDIVKKYGLAGLIAGGAAHFSLPADKSSQ